MPTRPSTQLSYLRLVDGCRALLVLAPSASLEEVADRLFCSPSTLKRALKRHHTTFTNESQAVRLDRAAHVLLGQGGRGQKIALINATRAAGTRHPRHLCAPFKTRFGVTPGVVWRIGCSIRELHSIAAAPAPHSRHQANAYVRRRRRIHHHQARLRNELRRLTPGTVIATAVQAALNLHAPHRAGPLPRSAMIRSGRRVGRGARRRRSQ